MTLINVMKLVKQQCLQMIPPLTSVSINASPLFDIDIVHMSKWLVDIKLTINVEK